MFQVSEGIVSPKLAWHPSKLLQELVAVATILLSAPLILKFVKGVHSLSPTALVRQRRRS